MKKSVFISLFIVVLIALISLLVYFTPLKNTFVTLFKPTQNQEDKTATKKNTQCLTPDECNAIQATKVAVAISAVQGYIKDPKVKLSMRKDTLKKQVVVFCSIDNKCWGYDNKTQKVSEVK